MDKKEFAEYVRFRCKQKKIGQLRYNYPVPPELTRVALPPIANQILTTNDLWTSQFSMDFLLVDVLKKCIVRKDTDERRDADSVFWADIVRRLSERYEVKPLIAEPKQRHQLWDRRLVSCVIAYIEKCNQSQNGLENKIAHDFLPELTIDEVIEINNQAINKIVFEHNNLPSPRKNQKQPLPISQRFIK